MRIFPLLLIMCFNGFSQSDTILNNFQINGDMGKYEEVTFIEKINDLVYNSIDSIVISKYECPNKNIYWVIETEWLDSIVIYKLYLGSVFNVFRKIKRENYSPKAFLVNGNLVILLDKANYFSRGSNQYSIKIRLNRPSSDLVGWVDRSFWVFYLVNDESKFVSRRIWNCN